LPRVSRVMHKLGIIRSVTHKYPLHGAAYALTGVPAIDVPMELNPRDPRHHPFIGSVVGHLDAKRRGVPTNIALPFPFSTRRTGEVQRAGPYAAFLGAACNPVWTSFKGEATAKMLKTLNADKIDVPEPYMGIAPEGRFEIAAGTDAPADLSLERMDRRRSLLSRFDAGRRALDRSEAGRGFDKHHGMALDLVRSAKVRSALDLAKETTRTREGYGMTLFGQGCLAARRLVEAGSRFVSVFWDEYGLAGSAWDTHWDHYARMKKELCPGFDHGLAGLVNDLDARGLLDETLVLCVSEHGRTPKMNNAAGGGRDHWSQAYSAVMAGGGVARGRVVGRTDKIAGEVADNPVSPKDLLATTYHLLGIDPETTLEDRQGRPIALVPEGRVLTDVLA
ncbi:MAG: DUF1501 domain-containing protein, partial [Gemmataceae bacterium]|nr:DUF1501 domain-containing protein [Gemmataceae bacterium]